MDSEAKKLYAPVFEVNTFDMLAEDKTTGCVFRFNS